MKRETPAPDADFDLLRGQFKEDCARIADLEAPPDTEPCPAEQVMQRFAAGLPQNGDGLHAARARARARLLALEAEAEAG